MPQFSTLLLNQCLHFDSFIPFLIILLESMNFNLTLYEDEHLLFRMTYNQSPSDSNIPREAPSANSIYKIIFLMLGIMWGEKKADYILISDFRGLSFWSTMLLKLGLRPQFPSDVYPRGHYQRLLCHFNNQICKFSLYIKSKQSNLRMTDIPACASTSIKPDVSPSLLPKVSIFMISCQATLAVDSSLMLR